MSVGEIGLETSDALNYSAFSWELCRFSYDDLTQRVKSAVFRVASYLTDPICKCHELMRRLHLVDHLHPTAMKVANVARKMLLVGAMAVCAFTALFTTLPGIALRGMGVYLQKEPFIHWKGDHKDKILPSDRTFSLLSWNICCVGAGYSISDGGVMPWRFRIDAIVDKILKKDADVNCLYETMDTSSAFYIAEKLQQNGYSHIYFNIGPKAVGASSGIMVASKYAIKNPQFTQFPLDSLVGRTKHAAKGVFGFDLQSKGKTFATVFATHPQHSAEPSYPTDEEIEARRKQMKIILEQVDKVKDRCVVVTGDLNLDDEEYRKSPWSSRFQKGDTFHDPDYTWGGDKVCAGIMSQRPSLPSNLDHTMVKAGSARSIRTSLVKTGYVGTLFKEKALSDHAGLFSQIGV